MASAAPVLDHPPLPPQQLAAGVPEAVTLLPLVKPVLSVRFELSVEVGQGLVPKLPDVPSLPPVALLAFQLINCADPSSDKIINKKEKKNFRVDCFIAGILEAAKVVANITDGICDYCNVCKRLYFTRVPAY